MDRDPRTDPPEWWDWPLALTPHLEARMEERGLSETELRTMLADATRVVSARRPGRFLASARHGRASWIVILEPDEDERLLYVVTAYAKDER